MDLWLRLCVCKCECECDQTVRINPDPGIYPWHLTMLDLPCHSLVFTAAVVVAGDRETALVELFKRHKCAPPSHPQPPNHPKPPIQVQG